MQTEADVSNTANVDLGSLYPHFVVFEMMRPQMSKKKGFFWSLCWIFIATIKLMNLILPSMSVLCLQVYKDV